MDELGVREFRYFVALAEEHSFSRAAERLGITQPSLSRAIRELEAKLGTRLFERTTRSVALTEPAAVLLDRAVPVLEAFDAAIRLTRRASQPEPRLIVTASLGLDAPALGKTIEAYHRANLDMPRALVAVRGWERADTMVRDGRVDVALLRTPFDRRGLDVDALTSEPQVALLAREHRLARRRRLHVADLAGQPIASSSGSDTEAAAPEPAADLAQLLEAVALGRAVALMPASISERLTCPDVVSRPVVDLGPSTLCVAWLERSRSLAVAAFVRAACAALASTAASGE